MVDSLRKGHFPLLVLEVGDFIETDAIKADLVNPFLIASMERDGVAALTLGPPEFAHWDQFQGWMGESRIPIVQTNVSFQEADRGQAIRTSAVVTVEGVRVGLLGVIGADAFEKIDASTKSALQFRDPVEAIEGELPALKAEGADLVVVLACAGDEEAARIAREALGADVVLSGYESYASTFPFLEGQAILNRSGSHGQFAGIVRLVLSPENEILDWGGRNTALFLKLPQDPAVAEQVSALEEAINQARMEAGRAPVVPPPCN